MKFHFNTISIVDIIRNSFQYFLYIDMNIDIKNHHQYHDIFIWYFLVVFLGF